jgi:hypothetical protein
MTDERGCHDDEVQVQQHGSVEKELLQPACMCKCAGAADRGDGREVGIRRSERHAKWAHGLEEPCNLAGVGLGLGIGIGGGLGCLTVAGRPASGSTYYLSISAYCFEWEDTAGHKNCSSVIFRPCLVLPILSQIPLCKKKIPRHIKISANAWSTKC